MAKLNFLGNAVCAALCVSVILWKETSSSSLGPYSTTTSGGGSDACEQITCPSDKVCIVNAENLTECVCNEVCNRIYAPVCGSDGQTYSNDCVLRVKACKTNTSITIIHEGGCNDNCTGYKCPYYGHCELDADKRPTCVCQLGCTKIYDPVCGSNRKTYGNECEMKSEACTTKTSITVLHYGSCDEVISSSSLAPDSANVNQETTASGGFTCVTCPPGKSCQPDSQDCVCNTMCPMIFDPVCGSDGKTYGNGCMLSVAACESNTNITAVHKGSCDDTTASTVRSTPRDRRTKKPRCQKRDC